MSNSTKVEEEGVEVNTSTLPGNFTHHGDDHHVGKAVPPNPTGKRNTSDSEANVKAGALPPFTITSEDGVNKIRRRFALAALVIAAGGAGVSIGTMTNKDIIAKAVDANTNFSKASKAPSKKQVCLADPFNDTYDNPCMCGVDEAMVADSRIMETSLKYRVKADSQEAVDSAVTSIEESIQKSIIKSGTCGPVSKDADQVIITEVSSSHVITDEPCPADDAKVCNVVSGGFTVKVGVTASHGGQEERMLQLDKPAKKELEAQLDGAIIQLQDELGLTKKEAKAIEKKLNKVLKAAIKSLSGCAACSIEISIVGDSIEIKVVPPTDPPSSQPSSSSQPSLSLQPSSSSEPSSEPCVLGGWKLNEEYCYISFELINPDNCFTFDTCPISAASGDTIGEFDYEGVNYSVSLKSITSNKVIMINISTFSTDRTLTLSEDGNSFTDKFGNPWTIA